MKRVLIATLTLVGFGAASFAQTVPVAKKKEPAKMQVMHKSTAKKVDGKTVAMNKNAKPVTAAPTKAPVSVKPALTKSEVAKTNTAAPVKKGGKAGMPLKSTKKHS